MIAEVKVNSIPEMGPIKAKFAPMKKEQEFYVGPKSNGNIVAVSENWIAIFDKFGKGTLSNGKNKKDFIFPSEFVSDCMKACPPLGPIILFDGKLVLDF